MAFEDAYGDVVVGSVESGIYDEISSEYGAVLKQLLPPGPAWWIDPGGDFMSLLTAFGHSFERVVFRGIDLLREFDPDTMFELLSDWERVLDLPSDNPSPATTLAGRRAAVHAKLLGHGDPTPALFEAVAVGAGYPDAEVNQHFLSSFVPGSVAGDPISTLWQYVWEMVCERGDDDALLQWTLEKLAPQHTELVMFWLLNIETQSFDTAGSATFRGVKYNGSNLWCAVGTNGAIQTSPDGETWTKRTAGGGYTGNFFDVSYDTANDLWCAVGTAGGIQTSPDGINWTQQTAAGAFAGVFYGIEHDQSGLWVAVGATGEIQTSPDGINWTQRSMAGGYTPTWYGVAHNGTRWVVAGMDNGSPYYGKLNVSTDGATWADQAPTGNPEAFYEVRYDGSSQFLVVGKDSQLQTSADGLDWRRRSPNADMNPALDFIAATYAGDRWVVIGQSGECHESWYGEDWKRHILSKTDFYAIAYGDGICVLVGGTAGDQVYTAEV